MEKEKDLIKDAAEEIIEEANEENEANHEPTMDPKTGKPMYKIKKEDRAFLYFRENGLGNLNIKFGPEKYTKDTSKFYDIFMFGAFKVISFLSGLTKNEDIMKRREHYNSISTSFSAVVNQAFPDVFEMLKQESIDEIETIKRVKEGHQVSPEFQEKFDKAKEELKARIPEKKILTVSETNIQLIKDIENQIELFTGVQEAMNVGWKINEDEIKEEDIDSKRIIFNLIESKIMDLSEQLKNYYVPEKEQQ